MILLILSVQIQYALIAKFLQTEKTFTLITIHPFKAEQKNQVEPLLISKFDLPEFIFYLIFCSCSLNCFYNFNDWND